MIASKIICDDTYSNKSWCIVGQGMFALREINQMEREMCSYLEWQLNVEPKILKEFEDKVCRDFAGPGPYPPIVLLQPAPSPFAHPGASLSTSIPSFGHRTSSPKPVLVAIAANQTMSSSSLSIPDTPPSSHSTSTSPASSASPPTPPDSHAPYDQVKIVSASANSSTFSLVDTSTNSSASSIVGASTNSSMTSATHPLNPQQPPCRRIHELFSASTSFPTHP